MSRIDKLRAATSERADKIKALLALPEDEQTDERAAVLRSLVDEQEPELVALAEAEALAERAAKAATVPTAKPYSPGPSATDLDIRSADRTEVRDAAKRVLDEARHAKDEQRTAAEKLLNGQYSYVNGDAFARRLVATERPEYRSAFHKAINGQADTLTDAERRAVAEVRAFGVTTDASGGFAVPVTIDPTILITTGTGLVGILPFCRVEPVLTDAWRGISSAAAAWSFDAELAEVSDDAMTLAQPSVDVHQTQAFIPYSIQWGEDYANAGAELQRAIVAGYYDQMASALMVGTGSAQPWGIFATTVTTVDVTTDNTFGAADIDKVWAALPELRRANATWVMNVDVENDVRGFGSGTATSRFTVDQTAEGISLLNGKRVVTSDYAPTWTGTDAASILVVGDFREFLVAQRVGMVVEYIPHVFSGTAGRPIAARGLYARARYGSNVTMAGAFRRLKNQTT